MLIKNKGLCGFMTIVFTLFSLFNPLFTTSVMADSANCTILIAATEVYGQKYTNNQDVSITLSSPSNYLYYKISNDPEFTNTQWIQKAATGPITLNSWKLSDGDGLKTVYVQFSANNNDAYDNNVNVIKLSDTVILDNTIPTVSINNQGGSYNTSQNITLTESDSNKGTIYYTLDGSEPNTGSTVYSGPILINSDETLKYFATDLAGNNSDIYTQNYIIDTTLPVLTLKGDNPMTVEAGTTFTDPGATATDNVDGDLTNKIIVTGSVDTTKVGTYTLTYSVTDGSSNTTTVDRPVKVVDTNSPVLTLKGDNPMSLEVGASFIDPGAIAVDNVDGDLTNKIIVTGSVDTTKVGTYALTYSVTDSSTNTVTVDRTVKVVNSTFPVLTLKGDNPMTVEVGTTFNDPGATATDNVDGDLTNEINVTGSVDTTKVGTYILTYSVTNNSSNTTTLDRTVKVVDTTSPVLTLKGDNPMSLEVGTTFTDPGATATDNLDGDLTNKINMSGEVDSTKAGTYTLTYNVSDSSGNQTTAIRTVNVTTNATSDITPPTLTVDNPVDNLVVNQNSVTVSGNVQDSDLASLKINGYSVSADVQGDFTVTLTNLPLGTDTITIIATDKAGNTTTVTRTVKTPTISLTSPSDNFQTNQPTVTVKGKGPTSGTVTVNGDLVLLDVYGSFSTTINLTEGGNILTVIGTDKQGYSSASVTRTVTYRAPTLTVSSPTGNLYTSSNTLTVSGRAEVGTAKVEVNGVEVTPDAYGNFSTSVTLTEGSNTITVVATGVGGLTTTVCRTVTFDNTAPTLTVDSPVDNIEVDQSSVTVSGNVQESNLASLKVNNYSVSADAQGSFNVTLTNLPLGTDTLNIIATDKAANTTTVIRTVKTPTVSVTSPIDNTQINQPTVTVKGKGPIGGTVTVNGNTVQLDPSGNFNTSVNLIVGSNAITVLGTDKQGYSSASIIRTVTYRAPTLTVSSPTDYLYTTSNTVIVSGRAEVGTAKVEVNGTGVLLDAYGNFSTSVILTEGSSSSISVVATGVGGLTTTINRTVTYDKTVPTLTVDSPADNLEVNQSSVTVSGNVQDLNLLSLKINDYSVSADAQGNFNTTLTNLPLGTDTIIIIATDKAGNTTTISRTIKTPTISLMTPSDNFQTNQPTLTVKGKGPIGGIVTVNGNTVSLDASGNFSSTLDLTEGSNTITVIGTDKQGYSSTNVIRTVIYRAPTLTVNSPTDNLYSTTETITVSGRAEVGTARVTVNGTEVTPDAYGKFSKDVILTDGSNTITVVATGVGGLTTTVSRTITLDKIAPILIVDNPADNLEVNQNSVTVSGNVQDSNLASLKINGYSANADAQGNFNVTLTNLTLGTDIITIIATDKAGNTMTITRTVKTPTISLTSPSDNFQTNQPTVTVKGKGPIGGTVTVNENPVLLDVYGSFSTTINLTEGSNIITVIGTDKQGYSSAGVTRTVTYRAPTLTVSSPTDNLYTSSNTITVGGRAEVGTAKVTVNGMEVIPDVYGKFSTQVALTEGSNTITVVAIGVGGLTTTVSRTINFDNAAPILTVDSPVDNSEISQSSAMVIGNVQDSNLASLKVNGYIVNADAQGNFSLTLTNLPLGTNTITIIAMDKAGNVTTITRTVTRIS